MIQTLLHPKSGNRQVIFVVNLLLFKPICSNFGVCNDRSRATTILYLFLFLSDKSTKYVQK